MDVLSFIPEDKRPIILERGMLLNLKKTVMFKRVVILHQAMNYVLFFSSIETRWIRNVVYKRHNISLVKSSPRQITYISRSCDSRRCNVNDDEVVSGLKTIWNRTIRVFLERMSYEDQVILMSNTDILISIHGAQLTNMMFMHKGGVVIEIMNTRLLSLKYYKDEASFCELKYICFQTRMVINVPPSLRNQRWNKYVYQSTKTDVNALQSIVQRLIHNWYYGVRPQ